MLFLKYVLTFDLGLHLDAMAVFLFLVIRDPMKADRLHTGFAI